MLLNRLSKFIIVAFATFAIGVSLFAFIVFRRPAAGTILPVEMQPVDEQSCFPGVSYVAAATPPPKGSYFPSGFFSDGIRDDGTFALGYSEHLRDLGEEPLYPTSDPKVVRFRMLMLRTFRPQVVVVNVIKYPGGYLLRTKTQDKYLVSDSEEIKTSERALTQAESKAFDDLIETQCFWELSHTSYGTPAWNSDSWLIEGVRSGQYHAVMRQSPSSGPVFKIARFLWSTAGIAN